MIKIISLLNRGTVEHNHEPMAKDTISTNEHENPRQPSSISECKKKFKIKINPTTTKQFN